MPIDTSIYQLSRPVQQPDQQPSMLDTLSKAYSVAGMANQLQTQRAVKDAYANNMNPDGSLNQQGVLSDLYKNAPQQAMTMQKSMAEASKAQSEAQTAQMGAQHAINSVTMPVMNYINSIPDSDTAGKQTALVQGIQKLKDQGVPTDNLTKFIPHASDGTPRYDPQSFGNLHTMMSKSSEALDLQMKQAEIAKTYSEVGQGPAKLNADLYGSRSPNAELSSQYAKDAAPMKGSQMPMKQMMDNYAHPSPQGDASLVLNAFKIKFPNAPDVNSLEELTKSQATPDQWKQMANHAISGGLDQGTRDNLMRDGISTFRANYDSLNDVKDRYNARAQQQNVRDPSLTYEPAMDRTYKQAMALQDKVGPYVPPSQRGGVSGTIAKVASAITGTGGGQSANAGDGVRMMGPDGKVRIIPQEMVGEAIAAGGKRVR